jgi:hypothetical protein
LDVRDRIDAKTPPPLGLLSRDLPSGQPLPMQEGPLRFLSREMNIVKMNSLIIGSNQGIQGLGFLPKRHLKFDWFKDHVKKADNDWALADRNR